MLYVILIFLPLALAAGMFVARDQRLPGVFAGVTLALLLLALLVWAPSAPPASWLGATLLLEPWNGILVGSWLLMVAGVLPASLAGAAGYRDTPVILFMVGAVSAALLVQQPSTTVLLLLVAMLSGSALLVNGTADELTTRSLIALGLRYMLLAVLGAAAIVAAYGLAGVGTWPAVLPAGLLLAGLSIWVLLLPTLLALAPAVEQISLPPFMLLAAALPPLAGVVIGRSAASAVDLAAAGLFPLVVLTLTMAAPLLAPPGPRRIMALLLLANACQLWLGVLLGADNGLRSALLGTIAHALALVLLLPGVMLQEQAMAGTGRQEPLAMAALLLGLLLLIGMPPLPGWYAKVELWYAVRAQSALLPWLFGAGQALLVAGAIRLTLGLRDVGSRAGKESNGRHRQHRGGLLLRVMLLLLIGGAMASGFAIRPLIDRVEAALGEREHAHVVLGGR